MPRVHGYHPYQHLEDDWFIYPHKRVPVPDSISTTEISNSIKTDADCESPSMFSDDSIRKAN